jgi:hypothetical protein
MLAGLMALVALGAVGAPAQADPPANPFAGSWSGTWSVPGEEHVGTYDWTISDQGRITGTVTNTFVNRSGTVVGHVDAGGNIKLIDYTPNDAPDTGQNGLCFWGTAVIDGDGKLVATFTVWGGRPFLFVAILERI